MNFKPSLFVALVLAITGGSGVLIAAPQDDVSVLMVERRSPCDIPEWWIEATNSSNTYEYKVRVQTSVRASVWPPLNPNICTIQKDVTLELERTGSSGACKSLQEPFETLAGCDCSVCSGQECPCTTIQDATVTIIAQRTPPADWEPILTVTECAYESNNGQLGDDACPLANLCKGNAPGNACD